MVLEVIIGPMFAGKSEELIKHIRKNLIARKKVQIFKHGFDKRYSKECLSSHNKTRIEATIAMSSSDVNNALQDDAEVIVIDEIQFFDDQIIKLCNKLADQGKHVIVSGLNLNFLGEPFKFPNSEKTMAELLAFADKITKLSAVCTYKDGNKICGQPATRTQRTVYSKSADAANPVLVGGSECYEARCRIHHKPITGQRSLNKNI